MDDKSISEQFLLWDCKATNTTTMLGFLNEKTFVCID